MRRLTLGRKKALIEQTKDMTLSERSPHLEEWGLSEKEFQIMARRYKEHGTMGIKNANLSAIRKKERFAIH